MLYSVIVRKVAQTFLTIKSWLPNTLTHPCKLNMWKIKFFLSPKGKSKVPVEPSSFLSTTLIFGDHSLYMWILIYKVNMTANSACSPFRFNQYRYCCEKCTNGGITCSVVRWSSSYPAEGLYSSPNVKSVIFVWFLHPFSTAHTRRNFRSKRLD